MEYLIHQIRDILIHPSKAFSELKEKQVTQGELTRKFILYLAAIPPIAGFLGKTIIGQSVPFIGYYHVPFFSGLLWSVLLYLLSIAGIYLLSIIVNSLSVNFGCVRDEVASFKLVMVCFVPLFILGFCSIIPALTGLFILGLYGIYLLYIGLPILSSCPEEKVLSFTVVISLIAIILTLLFYRIAGLAIVKSMPNF